MVPMGDNINHSSVSVTNELINLERHKLCTKADGKYFRRTKFMNDYSAIYGDLDGLEEKQRKNVTGHLNQKMFRAHNDLLSVDTMRAMWLNGTHIWNVCSLYE